MSGTGSGVLRVFCFAGSHGLSTGSGANRAACFRLTTWGTGSFLPAHCVHGVPRDHGSG
jgi:hypothetical protein